MKAKPATGSVLKTTILARGQKNNHVWWVGFGNHFVAVLTKNSTGCLGSGEFSKFCASQFVWWFGTFSVLCAQPPVNLSLEMAGITSLQN